MIIAKFLLRIFLILTLISIPLQSQERFTSIKGKNLAEVKALIESNPDLPETRDLNELTPLMVASYYGCTEIVRYLVEKGADVNYRRPNGEGPIHDAANFNFYEIVKFLVENGVDFHIVQECVNKYFDCGNPKCGFARIECRDCGMKLILCCAPRVEAGCQSSLS